MKRDSQANELAEQRTLLLRARTVGQKLGDPGPHRSASQGLPVRGALSGVASGSTQRVVVSWALLCPW
jgi:hypothetical protein